MIVPTVAPQAEGDLSISTESPDLTRRGAEKVQQPMLRATNEFAQSIAAIELDIRDRKDAQDALDAHTQYSSRASERQQAVEQLLGANAEGAAEREATELAKYRDELAGKLNPRARALYQNRATATSLAFNEATTKHEFKQRRQAFNDSITNNMNVGLSSMLAEQDPALRAKKQAYHRVEIDRAADALAKDNGWDAATKQAYTETRTTMMHVGLIEQMVNKGDASGAAAWFKSNKAEIMGQKHADIERLLKDGSIRQETNDYMDGTVAPALADVNDEAALAKAAPKLRADLRAHFKDDPFKRKQAEADLDVRLKEAAEGITMDKRIKQDAGWEAAEAAGWRLDRVPQSVLSDMDPQHRAALANYAHQRLTQPPVQRSNPSVMTPIIELWASGPGNMQGVRALADLDLNKVRPHLTDADFTRVAAAKREAAGLLAKPVDAEAKVAFNVSAANLANQILGPQHASDSDEKKTARGRFLVEVNNARDALLAEKRKSNPGAQLSVEESNDLMNFYAAKGARDGWLMGQRPAVGVTVEAEDIETFELDEQGLDRARRVLKQFGIAPKNDTEVQEWYRNFLRNRATQLEQPGEVVPQFRQMPVPPRGAKPFKSYKERNKSSAVPPGTTDAVGSGYDTEFPGA
jgi:hypothetical protein